MPVANKPRKPVTGTPENPLPAVPKEMLDQFLADDQTMSAEAVQTTSIALQSIGSAASSSARYGPAPAPLQERNSSLSPPRSFAMPQWSPEGRGQATVSTKAGPVI